MLSDNLHAAVVVFVAVTILSVIIFATNSCIDHDNAQILACRKAGGERIVLDRSISVCAKVQVIEPAP